MLEQFGDRPFRVIEATQADLERCEETTETGELLWIYSPERAVVDAMRLAHRVGRDTALHALNRYLRRPDAQPRHLAALARDLGGRRMLTDALEAVLASALLAEAPASVMGFASVRLDRD